jgi:hypothetical protein
MPRRKIVEPTLFKVAESLLERVCGITKSEHAALVQGQHGTVSRQCAKGMGDGPDEGPEPLLCFGKPLDGQAYQCLDLDTHHRFTSAALAFCIAEHIQAARTGGLPHAQQMLSLGVRPST